ncbi:glycosyltransferase family 39 protein [Candidatus Gottesmanbacteria bacterium]|nr:glycosyltransferase family 39 protein [Candidatus Gottesmanbacteria bacterium]
MSSRIMKRLGVGVLLFVIALIPRLYKLDLMEYNTDQIWSQYQVAEFFYKPTILTQGLTSSIGVSNPPLFHYILVLLNLFSRNPYYVTMQIAIINAVAIALFYVLLSKYYEEKIMLIASFLWIFSPWMMIFSRTIWAQNVLPLFIVPYLYYLHKLLIDQKSYAWIYIVLLLTLILQLHPSGLFLFVITMVVLIWKRPNISIPYMMYGLLIGSVPALPYVMNEIMAKPVCPDCHSLFTYLTHARLYDSQVLLRPFQIMNGLFFEYVFGESYIEFLARFSLMRYLNTIFVSESLFILLGVFTVMSQKRKRSIILSFLLGFPFLYLITKTPSYMHYFIIAFPFLCLIAAHGIAYIDARTYRYIPKASLYLTLGVVCTHIVFIAYFYTYLDSKRYVLGTYGLVFKDKEEYVKSHVGIYKSYPFYFSLETMAYLMLDENLLHAQLSDYFLRKNELQYSANEYSTLLQRKEELSR